jgi:trehalose-phosphatase
MQSILKFTSQIPGKYLKRQQLILLDYDGTIVPIRGKPPLARLSKAGKLELKKISRSPGIKLGIITGRALKDIHGLLGVKGILISANHGFEVYHKGKIFYPCGRGFKKPMDSLGKKLWEHLDHIPRLLLESKGFSVAVHFRLVPRKYWDDIECVMRRVSAPWRKRFNWKLTGGKRLWEVRPAVHWNKGDVALWIWKKFAPRSIPWYFGDDLTDEDAFRVLKNKGITVTVGRRTHSRAKYFAKGVSEVWKTLDFLIKRREG